MVVYCIQQQIEDENVARTEAAAWATEVLATSGDFLSVHLRKQVSTIPFLTRTREFTGTRVYFSGKRSRRRRGVACPENLHYWKRCIALSPQCQQKAFSLTSARCVPARERRGCSHSVVAAAVATHPQTPAEIAGSCDRRSGQAQRPARRNGQTGVLFVKLLCKIM